MKIQITAVDKEFLFQMHKILSSSAGYDISIQDELDYFDPTQSTNWFLAKSENNEQLGFIRFFEMNSDWSLGEFFVYPFLENRVEIGEKLLLSFSLKSSFSVGHKLRFDVPVHDYAINNLLMEKGFSHKKQTFKFFEIPTANFIDEDFKRVSIDNISETLIAEVLSNLVPVHSNEVTGWLENDQVRYVAVNGEIVAAAQISFGEKSLEIVRIATHLSFLRQGHAEKLIKDICKEGFQKSKSKVCLKVDVEKNPAIHLYKKIGFEEIIEKNQYWHSSWY